MDEPIRYTLDANKRPIRVGLLEWTIWMEQEENRIVGFDVVDGQEIVTFFVGFLRGVPPPEAAHLLFLWETRWDGIELVQYSSHEDALAGHRKTVYKYRYQRRSDFPN